MPDERILVAPFTPGQVAELNRWQTCGWVHEFTCGGPHPGISVALIATGAGWVCPVNGCDFTQDWAHAFMADGSLPETPWPVSS